MELNETSQVLVYADDLNLLSESVNTVNKSTVVILDTNTEVSLEADAYRTKCV
jgi:hypothetical protein